MQIITQSAIVTKTLSFYKEAEIWYVDLPSYLEEGLGTKANLMMVDGSDTFLDLISDNQAKTTLKLSSDPFEDLDAVLIKIRIGLNKGLLKYIGQSLFNYGAYYKVEKFQGETLNHELWLCPVTAYVFEGGYPKKIYIKKLDKK